MTCIVVCISFFTTHKLHLIGSLKNFINMSILFENIKTNTYKPQSPLVLPYDEMATLSYLINQLLVIICCNLNPSYPIEGLGHHNYAPLLRTG